MSSLQLFGASSASRRSASSASSGGWSHVSGKSEGGVGTKRTNLFFPEKAQPCCLGLIGSDGLLVCGKPAQECGTTHRGGKFEPSSELGELLYVRDPMLATRFLKEPVAQKAWFSTGTLKVMEESKKTVTEWAEFFNAAKEAAQIRGWGASELDINARLDFVEQAQEFATPAKVANLKSETYDFEGDIGPFSPFLSDADL